MVTRRSVGAVIAAGITPVRAGDVLLPGGVKDHTAQLQEKLDVGGAIHLGPGVFRVKTLRARKPFSLIGTGGQTRLEGDSSVLDIETPRAILRDVDFETVNAQDPVVAVRNALVFEASACIFRGGAFGLSLDSCGGLVSACRFSEQLKTGLFSLDARGLLFSGNDISGSGNNGIQVWRRETGEDGTQVLANRISNIRADDGGDGQNGNGINVYRAGSVIVSDNRITDVAFSGIRNNSGSNCSINGNSISRAGEVALYVEFGFQGAIVANNMIENVVFGISITNFNENGRLAVCSGNVVRNAHGGTSGKPRVGGGIFVEADTIVSNNVLEDINGYGIELGWGSNLRNLIASNNIIRNAKVGIAVSTGDGVGTAQVSGNVIDGAAVAIQGYDHEHASTGELAGENDKVPRHIGLRDNTIIQRS